MKNKILGVIVGSLMLCGLAWCRGDMPKEMIKDLQLSAAQAEQMQAVHQKQKVLPKASMKNIKQLHDQLDVELCKDKPDPEHAKKIIAEIKTLQGQMLDAHYSSLLEVRSILTTEQFRKMIDKKKQMGRNPRQHSRDKKDLPPPPMI